MTPDLEIKVRSLPNDPGVYQFLNKDEAVIYVGKAKNLKKRVSSYFVKKQDSGKTRLLVEKIRGIKHIVVATESDALLLENNLIKKLRPKYNILLRDDKSYPWICIKNERFPRIFSTRKLFKDGSEYYGPYTSMKTVRTILDLIKGIYPLRSCNYSLSASNIEKRKFKRCLEFHLGNCQAPCEGLQEASDYDHQIDSIRQILKGNFKESLLKLKNAMLEHANKLEFEQAQRIKEKIDILENYQSKSTVVNPKINNVDVYGIYSDEGHAYINYLQVANGAIVRSHTVEVKKKLEEADEEILPLVITELRTRFKPQAPEIYLQFKLELDAKTKITVPKLGDKKRLLDLSIQNARSFRVEQFKQMKIVDPDRHTQRIMAQMKNDLRLREQPTHIECFDNSNMQGSHPVAACVVFKNGKPSKKEYRHFNIKSVDGPNDFASMEEVILRRYKRLLEEDSPLPQLIVIDGGKGQLSSALKSLEVLGLRGKIAIIGIAKRLEELFFPDDPIPLYLDKKSETLKIIQQLRNEAHRFGITFHRQKRSKAAINSGLGEIEGIGPKTVERLLRKLKSTKRIKGASLEDLTTIVGQDKANKVYGYFHGKG